jgi:hypothetical protein
MKNNTDFEAYGKKVFYKVPPGFFENITGKTLEIAKQRMKKRDKIKRLGYSIAAAASVMILLTLAIVFNQQKPEQKLVYQHKDRQIDTIAKQPDATNPAFSESIINKSEINRDSANQETDASTENLESILLAMNKEELSFFAEQLSTEVLIDEIHNN